MSPKYEKPLLKPFRLPDTETVHGVACATGGNPGDTCGNGQNAQGFSCLAGNKAGCQVGSTFTGS